jgi:hypothetical protein
VSYGFKLETPSPPIHLVARRDSDVSPPVINTLLWETEPLTEKWRCVVVEDSGAEVNCHWRGGGSTRGSNGYARDDGRCVIPRPQKPCRVIRLRVYENDGRVAGEFRVPNPWPTKVR